MTTTEKHIRRQWVQNLLDKYGHNDGKRVVDRFCEAMPDQGEDVSPLEVMIQILSSECHRYEEDERVAVRLLLDDHDKTTHPSFVETARKLQENVDISAIRRPLLSEQFYRFIEQHADTVDDVFFKVIHTTSSFPLSLFGWKTLYRSYLMKTHEGVVERLDHMWYRIALFLHRDDWGKVANTFRGLRQGHFIHATPTLFAAGTIRPQMASCFLQGTRVLTSLGYKDIESIQPGEKVMTHHLTWKFVVASHTNRRNGRPVYHLQVYGTSHPIRATADHPFLVYDKNKRDFCWRNVEDLRRGDWIASSEQPVQEYTVDYDPQLTRNLDMIKGILFVYQFMSYPGESSCHQTVEIRSSKLGSFLSILPTVGIEYDYMGEGIRLKNISRWYPIKIKDYIPRSRTHFYDFLRGIRWTRFYHRGYYTLPTDRWNVLREVLEMKRISWKDVDNSDHKRILTRSSFSWFSHWFEKTIDGRRVVRLLSIQESRVNHGDDDLVHTLSVEKDHSYVVENVIVKNCFLVGMEDSVTGIYKTLSDCAQISKWAGGVGIHVSEIRGQNSYIYGTNGRSNGIVPMLKVYNDTARYIDQCFEGSTLVFTKRGLVPIRDLCVGEDRVLTRLGTFEDITKKLVYTLPPSELMEVEVDTPWGDTEKVIVSRAHTILWRYTTSPPDLNHQDQEGMVPLEEAKWKWQTCYVPLRQVHPIEWDVSDCYAMGVLYRILVSVNELEYRGRLISKDTTRVHTFLQTHYYGAFKMYRISEVFSEWEIHLQLKDRIVKTPHPLDLSMLNTRSPPMYFLLGSPQEKANAFWKGWSSVDKNGEVYDDKLSMAPAWQFWGKYCQGQRWNGQIRKIETYQGTEPVVVYDLEVMNDPSYQTIMGVVHNGGGKRNGAFAVYLEPWHSDVLPFLSAKRNTGPDEERARDLFYALWIPDYFMECVENDKDWYLMSPPQSSSLNRVWGKEFEEMYLRYIEEGRYTQKIRARELWKEILRSQIETGTPYLLYKDTCNRKSNQQNLGTIRSSNLCCEIIEYSDEKEYAVCNLGSISLPKCLFTPKTVFPEDIWIYGKDNCPYCRLLTGMLKERGISFVYRKNTEALSEQEIVRIRDKKTVPVVYTDGVYIGGFTEMWDKYLTPEFDFQRLGDITETLVENLNIVIDKNAYPLEECKRSNLRHRPIGIGVQGLADVFFRLLLPYDSSRARELNRRIFECIYYHALSASCRLAAKTGTYGSYEGSPLSKGIFHFELPGNQVQPILHLDWEALRLQIRIHGVKNSLLVAPMPTASTSQILGNTESFEPLTSNLYVRRTNAGEFYVTNPVLKWILRLLGEWDTPVMEQLVLWKGSVKGISCLPATLKTVFRTVWEIPQKAQIEMAADRQAFIDQSQSFNIHLTDPDPEKLTKIHFYGWKKGLKTGSYYVRTRASISSQNFTIDPEKTSSLSTTIKTLKEEDSSANHKSCEACSA